MSITPEEIEQSKLSGKGAEQYPTWDEFMEKVAARDMGFKKTFQDYWIAIVDQQIAAFDLPFPQAYNKLVKQIPAKLQTDVKTKPEAVIPRMMLIDNDRLYIMAVRGQNSLNALKTAVEIYRVKARIGRLPGNIPADSPKDLFSGKDFIYEKTETGFILRCRARDLSKDTIHEYEFKVAK